MIGVDAATTGEGKKYPFPLTAPNALKTFFFNLGAEASAVPFLFLLLFPPHCVYARARKSKTLKKGKKNQEMGVCERVAKEVFFGSSRDFYFEFSNSSLSLSISGKAAGIRVPRSNFSKLGRKLQIDQNIFRFC